MLDTNICIYTIRRQPSQVIDRLRQHHVGEIGVSSITAAELWYGVEKSTQRKKNSKALEQFFFPLEIVPFNTEAAEAYGMIRSLLESKGKPIGSLDTLIAAHARSLDLVLVTNNEREFKRVPKLRIENWAV